MKSHLLRTPHLTRCGRPAVTVATITDQAPTCLRCARDLALEQAAVVAAKALAAAGRTR